MPWRRETAPHAADGDNDPDRSPHSRAQGRREPERRGLAFLALDIALYLRHPRLMVSFRRHVGFWPRPSLPRRNNERYLWRKLFDHDPRFTECADKLRAKRRVAALHPDVRTPRTRWEGADPKAIPDDVLAGDCVVKANHGRGFNLLVRDGRVDRQDLERKARKWLRRRYYGRGRMEWSYRDIEPRLFVEDMVMSGGEPVTTEYKLYIAGGKLAYTYVKTDRHGDDPRDSVLDGDGRSHKIFMDRSCWATPCPKPALWERIVETAERMGAEFDFVRVDLYESGDEIWFSEYTFYSLSGYCHVEWPEVNAQMDRDWDIRRSWFLTTPQRGWRGRYARLLRRTLDAARGPHAPS